MKKIFRKLKNKTPTILSCLAVVGVVGTVVTAVKATPKAIKCIEKLDNPTKKDIFKETWTEYIPTAALGVGTIICILGSNFLNKKSQATITSAYAVMSNQFRRYSGEIKKRFGNETHEQIMHDIVVEDVADVHVMMPTITKNTSMIFDSEDEQELLFYDMVSKRYFKSTIGKVMAAIHYLNRNFSLGADPEVNMYYDFLGLSGVEYGDNIGWSLEDGQYWIDFEIFKSKIDDDTLECYVINPIFWPEPFETL